MRVADLNFTARRVDEELFNIRLYSARCLASRFLGGKPEYTQAILTADSDHLTAFYYVDRIRSNKSPADLIRLSYCELAYSKVASASLYLKELLKGIETATSSRRRTSCASADNYASANSASSANRPNR